MRVVGADLSITSTALALVDAGHLAQLFNHKTKGKKTDTYLDWCHRIEGVSERVVDKLNDWHGVADIDLLVIEAPSHGSKFGNPHERAALWWDVYRWAAERGIPVVTVAPSSRAKYITGDGRAKKDVVLAHAIERYASATGPRITNDDEADAVGLADMGARHLGIALVPDSLMPAPNLLPMEVVKWPTSTS